MNQQNKKEQFRRTHSIMACALLPPLRLSAWKLLSLSEKLLSWSQSCPLSCDSVGSTIPEQIMSTHENKREENTFAYRAEQKTMRTRTFRILRWTTEGQLLRTRVSCVHSVVKAQDHEDLDTAGVHPSEALMFAALSRHIAESIPRASMLLSKPRL